jgi:hypothetical protein
VDGYVNTNLTASGSVGWQGKNIAASGRTDGNAGVIFNTGLEDDGKLSARVNGRISSSPATVTTCRSRRTAAMKWSCRTVKTRSTATTSSAGVRASLTLYPGNVAVIEPEVKQMVTVSGVSARKTARCWRMRGLITISAVPAPMRTASL